MRFCPLCKYKLNVARTLEGKEGTGFLQCGYCQYDAPLENGSVLYDSFRTQSAQTVFEPQSALYDNFARKKIAKCDNRSCKTRDQPEVVVWKDDNFNVFYVCTQCQTVMRPN